MTKSMNLRLPGMLAVALAAVTALRCGASEPRADVAPMLKRLRSEAVVEWRAMADKLQHSRFDYTIDEIEGTGRTSLKRTKKVSGRVAGTCFLFTETIGATDQVSVFGRNDRYEFALSRTGDTPWMVSWQSARRDDGTPVGTAYAYLGGMLQLPWSISATPLERLVNDPRFLIREVQKGDRGDVRIVFIIAPAGAQSRRVATSFQWIRSVGSAAALGNQAVRGAVRQ